ncbi:MAG: NifU family protein [Candidatus Brocadiae bacterium]|nr:NifU family protein [Candidatus Brocadiia bacterium]
MSSKVEEVLDTLRINLQMDGGDIQLVEITEDKVVKVHFLGACCGCPSAQMTLKYYIERAVKEQIPDIKEVVMA